MSFGTVTLHETDYGTKDSTRKAIKRILRKKPKKFRDAIEKYIDSVLLDAKNICRQRAYDTGALHDSIRVERQKDVGGGSFEAGRDVFNEFMILAGGAPFINPKTGKVVDYAQAVHDGVPSRGRPVVPFLTDAVAMNKPTYDRLADEYLKWIQKEWEKKQGLRGRK